MRRYSTRGSVHRFPSPKPKPRRTEKIKTTLFDLIDAINDEIKAGEEDMVFLVISDLISTGRLKFTGPSIAFRPIQVGG
jgi:hypothetical protein